MFLYPAKDPGSSKPAVTQGWNISRYQSLCAARASAAGFSPAITFSTSFFTSWKACQYPRAARASRFLRSPASRSSLQWTRSGRHRSDRFRRRREDTVPCLPGVPAPSETPREPCHALIPKASRRGSRSERWDGSVWGISVRLQMDGFRGMTAVQQEPKQVRGVREARHHHLRLEWIQLKK